MFRFVKQNEEKGDPSPNVSSEHGINARQTYEEILQMPSAVHISANTKTTRRRRIQRKIPFDERDYFIAAANNDLSTLVRMSINAGDINRTDTFGWSALMMAAYEGHLDVVKYLIQQGAQIDCTDTHGNTADSLATKQNQIDVIRYLEQLHPSEHDVICLSSDDESVANKTASTTSTHCDTCSLDYKANEKIAHLTSTLHRFNDKSNQKTLKGFVIPESNVGYQLLVKQGWSGEDGLGCDKDGILFPVKTTIRKSRSGLGTKQPTKARVTHFQAFDQTAIQPSTLKSRSAAKSVMKTKRQIKNEKKRSQRKDRYLRRLLA